MRKQKQGRKLGRKIGPRKALLKSLALALILKEKIRTTETKAKELRPFLEPLITKAKKQNLSNQRELRKYFANELVKKMILKLGPRYKERQGGYTRIIKLGPRASDGAKMAIIELVK